MDTYTLILLGTTGVLTSTFTATLGYGGGSILMAVLLQFMAPAAAIPVHGLTQLVSNVWRVGLYRQHLYYPLIWRFLLLLPLGTLVGLWFFQGMSKKTVEVLIGLFILGTVYLRNIKITKGKDLPLWTFIPLGFLMGVLSMIVGVIAPLMGALTVRSEISRFQLIATLAVFATLGHLFKVGAFTFVGFDFLEFLPALTVLVPSVMAGGVLGRLLVSRVSESVFKLLFHTVLIGLSLKLVFWDYLAALIQ
ncbi:MAG: sulfite exporter TauE/SafE family protein [Deltaproteobacteria bacterium]|nr:sulfite exporter TauE/SafE family protein [Deltaproteobacteria bacterium]